MIIYHLTTCGRQFGRNKFLFECVCEMRDFIDSLRTKKPKLSKSQMNDWEALSDKGKDEFLIKHLCITRLDTNLLPEWQQLFPGEMYKCTNVQKRK